MGRSGCSLRLMASIPTGESGYRLGDLDPIVPDETREQMEAWARKCQSWQAERLEFAEGRAE